MSYLLSSVDPGQCPVLYCDTNGPTSTECLIACSFDWFSVSLLRLGNCGVVLIHRVVHSLAVGYIQHAVLLFVLFIMLHVVICLLCTLILSILASNSTDPQS